jgi:hypothetical protein
VDDERESSDTRREPQDSPERQDVAAAVTASESGDTDGQDSQSNGERRPWWRPGVPSHVTSAILGAVVGAVLAQAGPPLARSVDGWVFHRAHYEIVTPESGAPVTFPITVTGLVANVPKGTEVWVATETPEEDKALCCLGPQVSLRPNGTFTAKIYSAPGWNPGEHLVIRLCSVGGDGQLDIVRYWYSVDRADFEPPLDEVSQCDAQDVVADLVPRPGPSSSSGIALAAAVEEPVPHQETTATVLCKVTRGGVPVQGAKCRSVWKYKSGSPVEPGVTDSLGIARMARNIGSATSGLSVDVVITATWKGDTATDSVTFTPQ